MPQRLYVWSCPFNWQLIARIKQEKYIYWGKLTQLSGVSLSIINGNYLGEMWKWNNNCYRTASIIFSRQSNDSHLATILKPKQTENDGYLYNINAETLRSLL